MKETESPDVSGGRVIAAGCSFLMLAVNTVFLGLLAWSFSHGPYSSHEQEVWYRYRSIGYFLCGAVLPGIALFFTAKRSLIGTLALGAWMFATLIAAFMYAIMSSGGV